MHISSDLSLSAVSLGMLLDAMLLESLTLKLKSFSALEANANPQNNDYMFDLYSLFPPKGSF